jgi:hypothetical protein
MEPRRPVPNRGVLLLVGMVVALAIAVIVAIDFTDHRDRLEYNLGSGDSTMGRAEPGGP